MRPALREWGNTPPHGAKHPLAVQAPIYTQGIFQTRDNLPKYTEISNIKKGFAFQVPFSVHFMVGSDKRYKTLCLVHTLPHPMKKV